MALLDINECTLSNGGCSHKCVNTVGGYKCECPDLELNLGLDNKTCQGKYRLKTQYYLKVCYSFVSTISTFSGRSTCAICKYDMCTVYHRFQVLKYIFPLGFSLYLFSAGVDVCFFFSDSVSNIMKNIPLRY